MKIVLVGGMAAGKTTLGQALANQKGIPFYDTDSLIETKVGMAVTDIFKNLGEVKFRDLETEVLRELLDSKGNCVISTGGGIIKKFENRILLQDGAYVIFLDVSVEEQLRRTEGDTGRPLLMVQDKEATLQTLREERFAWYQSVAQSTIAVDGLSPEEVLKKVLILLTVM